jgi:peptidyl-tRNA hydrolase, PTH1 family
VNILVGLGNPGKRYERTPHNAGFAVIDELARQLSCPLRTSFRFEARLGKAVFGDERILLVQPKTFMNNSGLAVAPILRYNKADVADLLVILDDADLEFGRLRIRAAGSSGGHKGLASIIENVGSEEFARIRIGIGRSSEKSGLVEQVLTPFSKKEQAEMAQTVSKAAEAALCVLESGVETAMNRFNAKSAEQ